MGRRIRRSLLFLILLIALLVRLRGIENPLLDDQAWRQADTASMATHMLGRLVDFPSVFFPRLNYDGVTPQKVELEFPFLPYLLAWTWTFFGWADVWGRLWSVFLSLITVGGIYDLGRKMFTDRTGLLAAAIYTLMPLSIYYGRVVMPEPMAQAWSIWALAMIWRWRKTQDQKGIWKVGILMAGAILAKLPQLMLFPVAILLGFWPLNLKRIGQLVQYTMIAFIPPMVYYVWVHCGATHSSQFVSGILRGQVVENSNLEWKLLSRHLRQGLTFGVLMLSGAGMCRLIVLRSPARIALLTWGGISILYIGLVCARIPLDYYLVSILPLAALLSAYALDEIEDIPGTVSGILLLALITLSSHTGLTPKYQWNQEYLSQAKWIEDHTPATSILVLSDPPPMTFYYAHRVGFRLTEVRNEETSCEILRQIPGDYFVHLPQSKQKEIFWGEIRDNYPEIGPGIFDLKNPKPDY